MSVKFPAASISPNASVSLDLLRVTAALMVFFQHCNLLGLDHQVFAWFRRDVGHSAVIIFFVLSGTVIAAAQSSSTTALNYAIRRASRIYSVAVPALLLTLLIDLIMVHWHLPSNFASYQLRQPWIYVFLALTFSGDLWLISESAFSNVPYWSLNYEAWYYITFGVLTFARGWLRWTGLLFVLSIMGPKLWLLLPIWAGGVAAWRLQQSRPLPKCLARGVVATSIALFLTLKVLHIEDLINAGTQHLFIASFNFPLRYSRWFLGDYLVGSLAVALVYGLGSAEFQLTKLLQRMIVSSAKFSFSLYLVHYPLLQLFGALLPNFGGVAILLSLCGAAGFGSVFEPHKYFLCGLLKSQRGDNKKT